MEINDTKLKVMLDEHISRSVELNPLLKKSIDAIIDKMPEQALKDEILEVVRTTLKYYRHIGATWMLEGILNGTEFDWNRNRHIIPDNNTETLDTE